jgi:hypothetical protein
MYNNRPANNYYQPMVNVPTLNRLPTHGEVVASIELLIAQVGELSRKIDRVESRVNDWVNLSLAERMLIAEKGISALKTCHNDHDLKIATSENEIDDLFGYIKEIKDDARENDKCLDMFSDILTENTSKLRHAKQKSRNLAKKCAEIGVLRRRVSKCEDFNTEFIECFEAPLQLRGIVSNMSDKVDECDRTITHMVRYGDIEKGIHCSPLRTVHLPEDNTFWQDDHDDEMPPLDAINEYLSNYCEDDSTMNIQKNEVRLEHDGDANSEDEFVTL